MKRLLCIIFSLLLVATFAQAAQQPAKKKPKPNTAASATEQSTPQSGNRIALVIGNDSYKNVTPLQSARADAKAMAQALQNTGFKVTLKLDADERSIKSALREFKAGISGGDEAIFYYAGHGVQLGSANYLLPVDIHGESEEQVKDEAVPLQRVLDDLQDQKARFSLAIVDACRNNPFKGQGRAIGGRGLAPTQAATGQMVIFSAGAGQQALDRLGDKDNNPNGLFTRIFLKEMDKTGIPVDKMLRNVRNQVVQQAQSIGHEQVPALYDQALGEFYFKPGTQVATLTPEANLPSTPSRVQSTEEIEQEYWNGIKDSQSKTDLEDYLKQYPKGRFVVLAKQKLKTLNVTTIAAPVQAATQPAVAAAGSTEIEMIPIPSKNYAIGKYEVTQGQWKAVMGSNPSNFSSCGDTCPVEQVSWNDAQQFIQKLNSQTGQQYRLPSEAEWEYACRAGSQQEYCGSNNVDSVAWYDGNSDSKTHPAGQKQANVWGLYDMSGNVWEWAQDCDDGSCVGRVQRGGSWLYLPQYARAAFRDRGVPAYRNRDSGFRLARTLP